MGRPYAGAEGANALSLPALALMLCMFTVQTSSSCLSFAAGRRRGRGGGLLVAPTRADCAGRVHRCGGPACEGPPICGQRRRLARRAVPRRQGGADVGCAEGAPQAPHGRASGARLPLVRRAGRFRPIGRQRGLSTHPCWLPQLALAPGSSGAPFPHASLPPKPPSHLPKPHLITPHPPGSGAAEDHKPAAPDERARIMAAGGFLSEIGGITRVNGNLNLSRAIGDLRYKMNSEVGRWPGLALGEGREGGRRGCVCTQDEQRGMAWPGARGGKGGVETV